MLRLDLAAAIFASSSASFNQRFRNFKKLLLGFAGHRVGKTGTFASALEKFCYTHRRTTPSNLGMFLSGRNYAQFLVS